MTRFSGSLAPKDPPLAGPWGPLGGHFRVPRENRFSLFIVYLQYVFSVPLLRVKNRSCTKKTTFKIVQYFSCEFPKHQNRFWNFCVPARKKQHLGCSLSPGKVSSQKSAANYYPPGAKKMAFFLARAKKVVWLCIFGISGFSTFDFRATVENRVFSVFRFYRIGNQEVAGRDALWPRWSSAAGVLRRRGRQAAGAAGVMGEGRWSGLTPAGEAGLADEGYGRG